MVYIIRATLFNALLAELTATNIKQYTRNRLKKK